jgi:hypothetical protein
MDRRRYQSMKSLLDMDRREFLKVSGVVSAGLLLGSPAAWSQDQKDQKPPEKPKTNIDDVIGAPRTPFSLPGKFPGKVVEVHDPGAMVDDQPVAETIDAMFTRGITGLTGKSPAESFELFFTPDDVVGIKVNPVGGGLINTRHELVDAIIAWLLAGGLKRGNIIIWDRFDTMLAESGYTPERYPGIGIEGLQTLDETAIESEEGDNSGWLDEKGQHVSLGRFDQDVYYWADVDGPKDNNYLNQHVVNGKYSYFGKLVTQRLTKIINVPVFKNTGNGISMATKNLGYGAICNTGRLHRPIFFDVCTEVLAFPAIRDKLVLNITDGLRAQYDGGPMPNANFTYIYNTLFFATDPFASDWVGHRILVEKRKNMQVKVDEHPRFTDYLRYAERLGLGVISEDKLEHVRV